MNAFEKGYQAWRASKETPAAQPIKNNFELSSFDQKYLQWQYNTGRINEEQALAQLNKPYTDFIDQVNGILSGYDQFAQDYTARFGSRKHDLTDAWVGDSQQYLDNATAYKNNLFAQTDAILKALEENPDAFDKETVDQMKTALYTVRINAENILKAAQQDNDYWSSWGTGTKESFADRVLAIGENIRGNIFGNTTKTGADLYAEAQINYGFQQKYKGYGAKELWEASENVNNKDEKEWLYEESLRTLNLTTAQNELYALKQSLDLITAMGSAINALEQGLVINTEDDENGEAVKAKVEEALAVKQELFNKYGFESIDDLRAYIEKYEAYFDTAKRVQENIKFVSVKDNDDFEKYVKQGRDEAEEYAEESRRTNQMTGSEVKILAYYIAKDKEDGTNLAQQYKDHLDFYLKHRRAEEVADWLDDDGIIRAIISNGYAFAAKAADWGTSFAQNFVPNRKLERSVFQMADDYVGQNLTGIRRYTHGAAGVIGYMMPSIAIGKVVGGATGVQSLGKAAGSAAMFFGSAGQAYGDAIDKGYDKPAARAYSTLVGLSEVALQNVLGGISEFGGLPAKLGGKIDDIKNVLLKSAAKYGASIVGEEIEENLQNFLEPAIRAMVLGEEYDMPTKQEIIDTIIMTALSTGGMEGPRTVKNTIKDAKTQKLVGDQISQHSFLTSRERVVVNTITQKLVAEAEQSGKKLSQKEKQAIYDQVVDDMDTGRIDIKDIENSIGKGEKYEQLVSEFEELKELNKMKSEEMTGDQLDRRDELRKKNLEIGDKYGYGYRGYEKYIESYDKAFPKAVEGLAKSDRLAESYRERDRRSEAYKVENLNQYSEAQRKTIQSAMDSGILNNTRRTHEFVDFIAKVSEKLGVRFNFADNQRLKESGFAIDGVTVNGYVNQDGITINVNSAKALNRVVGHEITHILEGTDLYNRLAKAVTAYAKTKGEYKSRLEQLRELYKDKKGYTGEDAEEKFRAELIADLVGDYIFTDKAFVEKLFQEEPGLFKRILEEIKYLCKLVTAGSKEARQLEKSKKMFEKVVSEAKKNGVKNPTEEGGVKYAISGVHSNSADVQKLSVAEEMIAKGADSETVRKETGWFQGYDGKWRYEINDSELELLKNLSSPLYARYVDGEALRLDEVIKHDSLFAAYPELRNMSVEVKRTLGKNVAGSYDANSDVLRVSGSMYLTDDMLKEMLIHEIQHKIQNIEGFARGSSPKYWETRGIAEAEYERFVAQSEAERARLLAQLTNEERRDYLRYRETDKQIQVYTEALLNGRDSEYQNATVSMDDIEAENDALYKKLYSAKWFSRLNEIDNILDDGISEKLNTVFYKNTAGEIEARDVASRINYTDEQRKNTRPDIDRANVTFAKRGESLAYIGDTKDGRRCYKSGFDSSVSMKDRIEEFRKRIATIFNLGAVELKTDVKKIRILGDRFTSQKNLFGDKVGEAGEYEAKINALYDLADILATAKYDPTATNKEPSYTNPNIKPKNAAHKDVKYWYKFKNEIVFDGVPYTVTFNIRDKGAKQYQYLINFHENKTPGLSNTVVKNLLRADQTSYMDSIRNPEEKVNNKNSLSAQGQVEAAGGGWDVRGQDVSLPMPEGYQESPVAVGANEQAQPVNLPGLEKSQPQSQGKAQSGVLPMPKQTPKDQQTAAREALHEALFGKQQTGTRPVQQTTQQEVEDLDAEYRRQMGDDSSYYDPAEGEEIETARERLEVQRSNLQIELRENQRLRQEVIEEFDRKIETKQVQYDGKKHKHSKTAQALLRDIEKLKRKKADRLAEFDKAIAQIERRIEIKDEKLATNKPEKQDRLEKAYERIEKDRDAAELDLIKQYDAKKAEISKGLDNKEQWIKNKAFDVLWEMGEWVKGEKPSQTLGRIWDLRVDGHRLEWDDIKHALADIKDGYAVLPNQAEKAIREVLERTYQDRVTELAALEGSFNRDVEKLNKDAEKAKEEARKNESNLLRSELHEQIVGTVRQAFTDNKLDMDRVLADAKDLATIKTVDNTPQRVLEKALGRKAGQVLSDLTFNKVAQNETDGIRWLNSYTNRKDGVLKQLSEKYNIKPGSKESAAAQMYAEGFYVNEDNEIVEYGDRELAADFPDVKTQANIKGLAKDPTIRKIYDETLDLINASRVRNAYPEIQKLANYYLHFRAMGDTFSQLGLPFNPNDIRAMDLPTDLNGVTADLKPGQPYFASAQHREGKRTSFDLLGGLEMYLTSAKNQIFHIDDIQTLRALRNYVANVYGRANGLDNLDELTDEEQEAKIKEVYNSHLSTFAKFLNESANVLAGKTSLIDRGLEGIIGRRAMTALNDVNKQVGANMVGYNIGSPLTNFLSVMETLAKAEGFKGDFIKAAGQMAMNTFRGQSDGFAEKSSVIVRRKGAEQFNRTLWQKIGDPGYWLMSKTDEISTELIARTKYNELIRKGMDEKTAHYETDKWVSRLMGDRSLGQMPLIFNSKTLGMFTKFQLEVRNKLDSAFYDTIQEAKEIPQDVKNRNAKVAAKITSKMAQSVILDHVFGMAFQKIAGYNPAFDIISIIATAFGWNDDEDDDDTFLDNLEQAFFELLEDLPYTSTLTGGRIAIGNALPIKQLITGKDQYGNEKKRWKTLLGAIPYYVLPGGYGQAKKTVQGLDMYGAFDWLTGKDHSVPGNYTSDGRLRYTTDGGVLPFVRDAVFGKWSGQNAQRYIEEGRSPLSEKQTEEFFDLGVSIEEYWDIQDGLKQLNKESDSGRASINDIGDYIGGLDLTTEQKNILINNAAGRKEPIDMATYDEYPNFEEFDYGTQNPGKYAISQAVGGFEAFKEYQEDLKGLDKNEAADYINDLDIDYGMKIILYVSRYSSKASREEYGYDIVEYLNGRRDIDEAQMRKILRELGFKVDWQGNVTWD